MTAQNGMSSEAGAYDQNVWSGGINVALVDLIAMVVSDAGLASTEPQWWNASPLGCILIGCQPRGGWQVLQRAVQWGSDHWAKCFGVDCKLSFLYAFYACSIRNRLEVWESDHFISPMQPPEPVHAEPVTLTLPIEPLKGEPELDEKSATFKASAKVLEKTTTQDTLVPTAVVSMKSTKPDSSDWKPIDRGVKGRFLVQRPTKLLDGSRGGQAFMCDILRPEEGNAYGVEEQSRLQLLSVLLVIAGLTHTDEYDEFLTILGNGFGLSQHLESTFFRLLPRLLAANLVVIGFSASIFYALRRHNIYGAGAPYAVQLCSLIAWSSGAMGLLMLGGNPRVRVDWSKPAAKHIQKRLNMLDENGASNTTISFGSLHGSVYVQDRGTCVVSMQLLRNISRIKLVMVRHWTWYLGMAWFSCFLLIGVVLQIASSRVATLKSECMSITLLVLTAVLRGADWRAPRNG